jgi:hypothetical protein
LRAATPQDQRAVRAAADTLPVSKFLDAAAEIGRLGVGQALVSTVGPGGIPQPVDLMRVTAPSFGVSVSSGNSGVTTMTTRFGGPAGAVQGVRVEIVGSGGGGRSEQSGAVIERDGGRGFNEYWSRLLGGFYRRSRTL